MAVPKYPSKKAKRRAEYEERKRKREYNKWAEKKMKEANTLEELASALEVPLK